MNPVHLPPPPQAVCVSHTCPPPPPTSTVCEPCPPPAFQARKVSVRAAKRPLAELVRPEELQQAEETVGGQRGVGGVLAGWSERGGC